MEVEPVVCREPFRSETEAVAEEAAALLAAEVAAAEPVLLVDDTVLEHPANTIVELSTAAIRTAETIFFMFKFPPICSEWFN
jgi:hypothetical protein